MLTLSAGKFMATDLSPRNHDVMYPTICYAKDVKSVAVISGRRSKVVEGYDLQNDLWTVLPELNRAREDASSCYFKDILYVFGGKCCQKHLSSMERIQGHILQGHPS